MKNLLRFLKKSIPILGIGLLSMAINGCNPNIHITPPATGSQWNLNCDITVIGWPNGNACLFDENTDVLGASFSIDLLDEIDEKWVPDILTQRTSSDATIPGEGHRFDDVPIPSDGYFRLRVNVRGDCDNCCYTNGQCDPKDGKTDFYSERTETGTSNSSLQMDANVEFVYCPSCCN